MERLQGPINPCFFGEEHLDVETTKTMGFSCFGQFVSTDHSLSFEEEEEEEGQQQSPRLKRSRSLEDKMPFLEMLQSVESPSFSSFCELSFQALLNLQESKTPWDQSHSFQAPEQPESCLTHDVLVKSETKDDHYQHPHSTCCAADGASSDCYKHQLQLKTVERMREGNKSSGPETTPRDQSGLTVTPPPAVNSEKRKRTKRTRPAKNKEEVESQRMTHIAVERNRRRQMNDHLTALRSLMPSSYIQRGDQASIIGGAIDFLKELEQLHQSLQAQKRMRKSELLDQGGGDTASPSTSSTSSSTATVPVNGTFAATSPTSQYRNIKPENCTEEEDEGNNTRRSYEFTAEKKSAAADVRVTVIQNHVNLKVECPRITGQLLKAIVALEDLRLTVLHLNITSLETSVHYSFNLKVEDECEVGSADGIAVAVHQIFSSFVNGDG